MHILMIVSVSSVLGAKIKESSVMKKFILAMILAVAGMLPSLGQAETTSFYTDPAQGNFPLAGQGGMTVTVPFPNAQVRVCDFPATGSPCSNTADNQVFDLSGNPIFVLGGQFGQVTADATGRFTFGCSVGVYQLQMAPQGSNIPA